jgi:hypothetical protein
LCVTAAAQTLYPTLTYGLAESQGDAYSTSNGAWGSAEFGYNPISNNLGASFSVGSAGSSNVASAEEIGSVKPGDWQDSICSRGMMVDAVCCKILLPNVDQRAQVDRVYANSSCLQIAAYVGA